MHHRGFIEIFLAIFFVYIITHLYLLAPYRTFV